MVTTIQIQSETLELLKKMKETTKARSYDETITKIVTERMSKGSMAGIIGRKPRKWILKGLRDKSDRF